MRPRARGDNDNVPTFSANRARAPTRGVRQRSLHFAIVSVKPVTGGLMSAPEMASAAVTVAPRL